MMESAGGHSLSIGQALEPWILGTMSVASKDSTPVGSLSDTIEIHQLLPFPLWMKLCLD